MRVSVDEQSLNSAVSRRAFIKLSVAATTAAMVGLPGGLLAADPEAGWKWQKGVCRFCGVG